MASGLVVLEGRWERARNISVRSLFDLLVDMQFGSSHKYHFENFATGESLKEIIGSVCRNHSRKKYIYIGAHGNSNYIQGSVQHVSRTVLNNIFREKLGAGIKGIFFGACLFGNKKNAQFFFDMEAGVLRNVTWIAGYGKSVDWVESSILDILFWKKIFEIKAANPKLRESEVIKNVCNYLNENAKGLVADLEFQVFRRQPHHPDTPESLIKWGH